MAHYSHKRERSLLQTLLSLSPLTTPSLSLVKVESGAILVRVEREGEGKEKENEEKRKITQRVVSLPALRFSVLSGAFPSSVLVLYQNALWFVNQDKVEIEEYSPFSGFYLGVLSSLFSPLPPLTYFSGFGKNGVDCREEKFGLFCFIFQLFGTFLSAFSKVFSWGVYLVFLLFFSSL